MSCTRNIPIRSLHSDPRSHAAGKRGGDKFLLDGRLRAALTWFDRNTRDQIDFFDCFGPTSPACDLRYLVGGYYFNIGNSRARGFEGEATLKLSETLKASIAYTDMTATVLTTNADARLVAGNDLARTPHILASANVFWTPVTAVSVGAGIVHVGRRWDNVGNTVPLSGSTMVNFYGSYALDERLELYGRVENLFDSQAEPDFGYGAPGRAFYAGIRAHY